MAESGAHPALGFSELREEARGVHLQAARLVATAAQVAAEVTLMEPEPREMPQVTEAVTTAETLEAWARNMAPAAAEDTPQSELLEPPQQAETVAQA
jgi:hypothetical protein